MNQTKMPALTPFIHGGGPVVKQAQTSGKEIVDYAFWKGILLVVVVLVAALIYRFLSTRLFPMSSTMGTPK